MGHVTPDFGAVCVVSKTGDGEKYRKLKIAAGHDAHYALICRTYRAFVNPGQAALGIEARFPADGDLNDITSPCPTIR